RLAVRGAGPGGAGDADGAAAHLASAAQPAGRRWRPDRRGLAGARAAIPAGAADHSPGRRDLYRPDAQGRAVAGRARIRQRHPPETLAMTYECILTAVHGDGPRKTGLITLNRPKAL